MRHVAVITGTRAEYGLLKPVIDRITASPHLQLSLLVTGMHLSPEYGHTLKQIEADGVPITAKVDMLLSSDTSAAMAKGMGIGIYGLTQEIERLRPDVVLVLGDRVEAFAGAVAGLFCGALVAHLHGGEITQGGLDEYMRHAITKLSHIHFAATEKSRERIVKMGENPDFVYAVGAPGLDALLQYPQLSDEEISRALGYPLPSRYALMAQHPISTHPQSAVAEITATLEALKSVQIETIVSYPNSDAGSREMIQVIRRYEMEGWLKSFVSVPRGVFCNLLRRASVLVGNSSSGMLDSASFGLPTINIGERQEGRERGENVIDAPPNTTEIERTLRTALEDPAFIVKAKQAKNPYGDGRASERIVQIIESLNLQAPRQAKRLPW